MRTFIFSDNCNFTTSATLGISSYIGNIIKIQNVHRHQNHWQSTTLQRATVVQVQATIHVFSLAVQLLSHGSLFAWIAAGVGATGRFVQVTLSPGWWEQTTSASSEGSLPDALPIWICPKFWGPNHPKAIGCSLLKWSILFCPFLI